MNVIDFIKLAEVTRSDLKRMKRGMLRSGMLRTSGTGQEVRPEMSSNRLMRRAAQDKFSQYSDNQWKMINPEMGSAFGTGRRYAQSPEGLANFMQDRRERAYASKGVHIGGDRKPKVIMPNDIPFMTRGMNKADKDTFMLTVAGHENREARSARRSSRKRGDSRFSSHLDFGPYRVDVNTKNALKNPAVSAAIADARKSDLVLLKTMFPDLADDLDKGFSGEKKMNRHFEKMMNRRLAEFNAQGKKVKTTDLIKTRIGDTSAVKAIKKLFRR